MYLTKNNGMMRLSSKLDVLSTLFLKLKIEIKAPKPTPKLNLRLFQLKLGKLEFKGVTKHKNYDDATSFFSQI